MPTITKALINSDQYLIGKPPSDSLPAVLPVERGGTGVTSWDLLGANIFHRRYVVHPDIVYCRADNGNAMSYTVNRFPKAYGQISGASGIAYGWNFSAGNDSYGTYLYFDTNIGCVVATPLDSGNYRAAAQTYGTYAIVYCRNRNDSYGWPGFSFVAF